MAASALFSEAVPRTFSVKKVFLNISQNLQEDTCVGVSESLQLYPKMLPAQVFSQKYEMFKNTYFVVLFLKGAPKL